MSEATDERMMVGLSASERACYLWPDDTELHRACRAAYIAGAMDHLVERLRGHARARQREGPAMKHHIERTSPKGEPFIGTCRLCGKSGLPAEAALEDCENVRGLSVDDALLEAITGRGKDQK